MVSPSNFITIFFSISLKLNFIFFILILFFSFSSSFTCNRLHETSGWYTPTTWDELGLMSKLFCIYFYTHTIEKNQTKKQPISLYIYLYIIHSLSFIYRTTNFTIYNRTPNFYNALKIYSIHLHKHEYKI